MYEFITLLNHASFRIELSKILYIDPWKLKESEKADIILISHPHYDHFSKEDIDKIYSNGTTIITVEDVASELSGYNLVKVKPGDTITVSGIKITATRAYNKNKEFHPKKNDWVGFIIEEEGLRIYYAGDTDLIDEMDDIKDIDVALLPIGGKYTMDSSEASDAVSILEPKAVIPYHYGDIVGSREDFEEFKKLCLEMMPDLIVIDKEDQSS